MRPSIMPAAAELLLGRKQPCAAHPNAGRAPMKNPAKSPAEDRIADALPENYDGLRTLQAEFCRYQNVAFPYRPPRFFALELAGETGELANLEKKAWKGRAVRDEDFADESADVCIALLNFANSRGIDLAGAVREKMKRIDDRRREEAPAAGAR